MSIKLMNNLIDIKQTSIKISQIKYPYIFMFLLITNKNNITDVNFSIILRLFLKHHSNTVLNINVKSILENELIYYKFSQKVLNDFYKLCNKKISILIMLKKWYQMYNYKKFWKLSPQEQLKYIINMQEQFLAIFDCSKNGTPYHYKIGALLKDTDYNNSEILTNIQSRLKLILKLFGIKIFQAMQIPIIDVYEFDELPNESIVKYLFLIFNNMNQLLTQTIKLFNVYNEICIELEKLFNPQIF
jgi:hypothetical protein